MIGGGTVLAAATIFYVNGPYNPGAPYDPNHVPSTNQFCLQCHFNHSSQYFGSTTVGTAF
jgi:nitrate/TMAO reductase-like tetraheme cytochrome c subunit